MTTHVVNPAGFENLEYSTYVVEDDRDLTIVATVYGRTREEAEIRATRIAWALDEEDNETIEG